MRRLCLLLPPLVLFAAGAGAARYWPGEKEKVPALSASKPGPQAPVAAKPPPAPDPSTLFLQRLEATPAADFAALWEEVKQQKPGDSRLFAEISVEALLLFTRWAEVDPAAALKAAQGAEKGQSQLLGIVFGTWAERDPDAAVAAASSLKDQGQRMTALAAIFALAMRSPGELTPRMLRMAPFLGAGMPEDLWSQTVRPNALAAAAAKDPAAFREMTAALPEKFQRQFVLAEWCAGAAKDLPAALARMDALKLNTDDAGKLLRMLHSLTASQPATLAAVAEKLPPNWIGGNNVPSYLLIALAKAAPERIHEFTDKVSTLGTSAIMTTHEAAIQLFDSDPQLALKLSGVGDALVPEILGFSVPDMARTQPRAALDLLRDAPPSTLRQSILMESLTRLRTESPEAARQWVDSLGDGSLKDAARVLVDQPELSRTAAQFSMALATASAEDATAAFREQIDSMLKRYMTTDPLVTAAQITALPPGNLRENSLRTAGQEWAEVSTPDALAWSETLTGADRIAAQSGIVRNWAEYEPAAASEFVHSMPPGPERDGPAAALARGVSITDPAAGLEWATTITDPARRTEVLQEVAQGWLKDSPTAARQAVSQLPGLSETERAALLTPPAK